VFFVSLRFLTPPLAEFSLLQLTKALFFHDFAPKLRKRKTKKLPRLLIRKIVLHLFRLVVIEARKKNIKLSKRKTLYEIEVLVYILLVEL